MPTPDLPSPLALEEIFRAAAALPAADRAPYLDSACDGQPAVRARLERMLALGGIAALLQQGGDETVPLEIEAELARLKPEDGGERIGNYKLLQQIGQGGFGIVWMAEQIEPVRRRVALKIIKLGMDTKEVIARFEQERQALAMMDHSNIAKVFDAGVTPTGRPFFVMELVRGIKITEYCDQANLSTPERLTLFIAVCHAVQHAHQKGIIHRDLKPSNILVTLHDGVPVPKVIDFGVAKATQAQRLTDLTFFTQFEQMIGTPLYMSPEQAEMSGLDIDTRSDIYSLGVLLYELLAGRTPFDPQELMRKGVDEMRRAIREQEPPKPSTALHTMAAAARTTIAQHRQADGAKLMGLIRGDLDWIVMKALEKDRTRRYETANGLAADLKRHLNHEPVLACPPSAKYRLQKAFGRNKLLFTSAGAVAIALVLGMLVSSWQMLVARRARQGEIEQRELAQGAQKQAAANADQATARLFDSLVGQARATRIARQTGYREEVFDLVRKARDLRVPEKGMADLRREAAACMGDFVGLRPRKILSALTNNSLERMQVSKDGHVLAVQDADGTVRLCDLPSGRELGRWKTGREFHGFAFNGASDQLLLAHVPPGTNQTVAQRDAVTHFMMLSRTQSGQWVQSASGPLPDIVTCVTDGESLLAVVAGDTWPAREFRLVQPETGRVVQRFTRTEGHWSRSGLVALSPDGRFFAAAVESILEAGKGPVEIWDVARQRLVKSLQPQRWATLTFSPNSHWLLCLAMEGGTIYDTEGFEIADQFSGFYEGLVGGAFQPGGTLVAFPKSQPGRVLLRDLRRHEDVAEFYEPEFPRFTAFAPDGSFLVIANTTGVNLYSLDGLEECLDLKGHSMGVTAVAFSPNGSQLVSVGKDSSLQLWDATSGRHIWSGSQLLPTLAHSVCFSPDGKLLATGESGRSDVLLWEAQTGRLLCQLTNGHTGISWSLQFLPESKEGLYLIRGGGWWWRTLGASVALWKVSSTDDVLHNVPHAVEQVASLSNGGVMGLVVAPAGDRMAYMDWPDSGDVEVTVSEVLGKRTPKCLMSADANYLSNQPLAFTPDGKNVLALLPESRILVLNVATGQTNRSFKVNGRENVCSRNFTLSPNGRMLAIVARTKRAVEIYDFEMGEHLYTLQGQDGTVWWLAWHPTEPRLAVSRDNGAISIWDLSRIDRQLEQLGFGEVGGSMAQTLH